MRFGANLINSLRFERPAPSSVGELTSIGEGSEFRPPPCSKASTPEWGMRTNFPPRRKNCNSPRFIRLRTCRSEHSHRSASWLGVQAARSIPNSLSVLRLGLAFVSPTVSSARSCLEPGQGLVDDASYRLRPRWLRRRLCLNPGVQDGDRLHGYLNSFRRGLHPTWGSPHLLFYNF